MSASPYLAPLPLRAAHTTQLGIALITALLLLVMLTLLAITMFRGFGLQQKVAGNTREKERAFQAAETVLQHAEYWLTTAPPSTGAPCSGTVTVNSDTDLVVCSNPLSTPATPSAWPGSLKLKPGGMVVDAAGGTVTNGNGNVDINYTQVPDLYVSYLGADPTGKKSLYSITSAAYGGNSSTNAVVQSVFSTQSRILDLGQP
jgi:type IV pilus assembly protein PilX